MDICLLGGDCEDVKPGDPIRTDPNDPAGVTGDRIVPENLEADQPNTKPERFCEKVLVKLGDAGNPEECGNCPPRHQIRVQQTGRPEKVIVSHSEQLELFASAVGGKALSGTALRVGGGTTLWVQGVKASATMLDAWVRVRCESLARVPRRFQDEVRFTVLWGDVTCRTRGKVSPDNEARDDWMRSLGGLDDLGVFVAPQQGNPTAKQVVAGVEVVGSIQPPDFQWFQALPQGATTVVSVFRGALVPAFPGPVPVSSVSAVTTGFVFKRRLVNRARFRPTARGKLAHNANDRLQNKPDDDTVAPFPAAGRIPAQTNVFQDVNPGQVGGELRIYTLDGPGWPEDGRVAASRWNFHQWVTWTCGTESVRCSTVLPWSARITVKKDGVTPSGAGRKNIVQCGKLVALAPDTKDLPAAEIKEIDVDGTTQASTREPIPLPKGKDKIEVCMTGLNLRFLSEPLPRNDPKVSARVTAGIQLVCGSLCIPGTVELSKSEQPAAVQDVKIGDVDGRKAPTKLCVSFDIKANRDLLVKGQTCKLRLRTGTGNILTRDGTITD